MVDEHLLILGSDLRARRGLTDYNDEYYDRFYNEAGPTVVREINEAAQLVSNSAAVDANIIFGAVIDDALGDEVRVTVIAAGFDEAQPNRAASAPLTVSRSSGPSSVLQPLLALRTR